MSKIAKNLYQLLPAIHRIRDAEQGYPLRELLGVIAEQVAAMEENLEQLYDDQFIETCAQWAAPYIGDLIGYRTLHGEVPGVASPRADVANTIRYRRRKGTATMLEQLARDVTGWPARVVEFFQVLGWNQNMNHLRQDNHYSPDLRRWEKLQWLGSPFETTSRSVEVRRIQTGAGKYNIPNIGIFFYRVQPFPLSRSPAVVDEDVGGGLLLHFNPLGSDMQLYNREETEEEISQLAEPIHVPLPLSRRLLKSRLENYYGPGKSLLLEVAGATPGEPVQAIPLANICICDLSDIKDSGGTVIDWGHQVLPDGYVAGIDPVLGRIRFRDPPAGQVLTSFHYGFTSKIGGGEYQRDAAEAAEPDVEVAGGASLQPQLSSLESGGVIEISDSYRYTETPVINVGPGQTLTLQSTNGHRPLLLSNGDINLNLGAGSTLILDGLVLSGGRLVLPDAGDDEPRTLILRDCTLVPGSLPATGSPSISVAHPFAKIELTRCITGPIHLHTDGEIKLLDSIIDATDPELVAFRHTGIDQLAPGGIMTLTNCTVIGKVHTRILQLASNCLFHAHLAAAGETWLAPLWVERRQLGCVRFSFIPRDSRTPRRYRCQPGLGDLQTRPRFNSLTYGEPAYCQLHPATPDTIRRGAHDEGEMGVMHNLYQPQREANIKIRLDEYLRFGLQANVFYVS